MQQMRSITRAEFDALPFNHNVTGPHPMLHEVVECWRTDDRAGVIIRDKVDHDWSFVALAKNPSNLWQGYASNTSLETIEAARSALREAFDETLTDGWWE